MEKELSKIFQKVLSIFIECFKGEFHGIYIKIDEYEENIIGFIKPKENNYQIVINRKWIEKLKKVNKNIRNGFLSFVITHELLHVIRNDLIHNFLVLQEREEELMENINSIINGKIPNSINEAFKGPLEFYFFSEKLKTWYEAYINGLKQLGHNITIKDNKNDEFLENKKLKDENLIKDKFKIIILLVLFKLTKPIRITGPSTLKEKYSYKWFNGCKRLRENVKKIIVNSHLFNFDKNLKLSLLNTFELKVNLKESKFKSSSEYFIGSRLFKECLNELIKDGYIEKDILFINKKIKPMYRYRITNKGIKYLFNSLTSNY
jgi:hypothetical protein